MILFICCFFLRVGCITAITAPPISVMPSSRWASLCRWAHLWSLKAFQKKNLMLQDFAYFVICLSLKKKKKNSLKMLIYFNFFRLWFQPNTYSIISFDGHKSRSGTLVWENENQPIPSPRSTITQYTLLVAQSYDCKMQTFSTFSLTFLI